MRRLAIKSSSAKKRAKSSHSESRSIIAQPENNMSESQFREFQKLNRIFKGQCVKENLSNTKSSRIARRILNEYVQMADDEIEMIEDEQDVLDATSRHSRISSTTPPQAVRSVRKELKFAYQGLLNTSITPTNANYSMTAGNNTKGAGNASSSYMLPHSQVYSDSCADVESRGGRSHTPASQKDRVLRSSLKKPTSQNGEMSPNV